MHRSPYFGQSVEFLQHREYVMGDELRHVDWKVWARQDRLYVKQFEEETNLRCLLMVDVSNSMAYGRGAFNKYEYACTAAACLAYLILRQHDAVGCLSFDEKVRRSKRRMRTKRTHLQAIIETLNVTTPRDKTDLYGVFSHVVESYPRRGMVVVISDLLAEPARLLKGLTLLRQRGHDVLVLHVMDDDELDFPFTGPTRFEGLELPDAVNCNPRALRDGYLEALGKFLEETRRQCARHQIDYQLLRTSDPLDAVLTAFLSKRLG
jgi:uncharacterized protein (DUF58 family)